MSLGLLKSSKVKIKLFKKCLGKCKNHQNHINFTKYRNSFEKLKRAAKQNYYSTEFAKYKNSPRNTWKLINNIIGRKQGGDSISAVFKIDNVEVTDSKIITQKFCEYFSNIGRKYASEIPPSTKPFHQYLSKPPVTNSLFMAPTDPSEIVSILKSMKSKSSTGHDEISSKLLKSLQESVSVPLSFIINKSLESGIVPQKYENWQSCSDL